MKTIKNIAETLIAHGWVKTTVPNEYKKGNKKGVVWPNNNMLTVVTYSAKHGQFLVSRTYTKDELEKVINNI